MPLACWCCCRVWSDERRELSVSADGAVFDVGRSEIWRSEEVKKFDRPEMGNKIGVLILKL